MLQRVTIKNFKSIVDVSVDLGRFNVFIGENGCGKTNILEALAMFAAAKSHALDNESLYSRGIRIAKPSITFSSFVGHRSAKSIEITCAEGPATEAVVSLTSLTPDNILASWIDLSRDYDKHEEQFIRREVSKLEQLMRQTRERGVLAAKRQSLKLLEDRASHLAKLVAQMGEIGSGTPDVDDFLIYCLNTPALRGIQTQSRKAPLGIYGESLDILISQFTSDEIKELQAYAYLIPWLKDFTIDAEDRLKFDGHKLGRSTSTLYFKDRFMGRRNNVFSAENANEGVLHVLFYLTLFISNRTPKLFGIDNIEASLNPKVCRTLVKELATLARKHEKQALITTHNPAVLDGLNLYDDEQRLFVVSRSDEGHTRVKRVQLKEKPEGESCKLSELWMRGVLGGLPVNF